MTMLDEWAAEWQIDPRAVASLRACMGVMPTAREVPPEQANHLEAAVSQRIRLSEARAGTHLWRNNVGAMQDEGGRWVRFGLANDSKQMNETFKSGDLIGCRPVVIDPHMVGWTLGQFVSFEAKRPGWKFTGTDREVAQLKWAELVNSLGGYACFRTE